MSLHLEIASGKYQDEGLGFKRNTSNCHKIEDSFLFIVTDADSDEKTENLPMILAQVEKANFKPYKKK